MQIGLESISKGINHLGECPYDRQIKRQIDLRYSGSLQRAKNSENFLQKNFILLEWTVDLVKVFAPLDDS